MWGFIVIILIIYNLLLFYIGWNGWKWLGTIGVVKRPIKYIYWVILVVFAYSIFLARSVGDSLLITWISVLWLTLFYFLILFLPLVNLVVFLSKFTRISKRMAIKWSGFTTISVIFCLFMFGLYYAYSPTVTSYQINIPKLVEGKQSLKIVMASDMHFGVLSGANHAKNLVEHINQMDPDFVLFPGDIIDDDVVPYLDKGIPDVLKQIKAPVYTSFGNHDRDEDADLIKVFTDSGMRVLSDEALVLDNGITLVGRKDRGYRDIIRLELADLMKEVDLTKPVFLLEHQPYDFDIAQKNGVDLILSGHTHQGQIAPINLITNMIFENDWGYLKKGKLQSIVSSGYGFWGVPIRIGTRSEIVQINVSFGRKQ